MTVDRTLTIAEAETLVVRALTANRVSDANAVSVARALVAAEVDGQGGHGFSRVKAYAAQAKSGKVDGFAEPKATRAAPAWLSVDAANGFAFPAIDMTIDHLGDLAKETGLAGAGITRSHHCGQLGAHVERLAEMGLVALMVANAPKAMAPWGGNAPLFGTNPIAFSVPRDGVPPLVIDLSLSKVARGKVMAAAKRGEAIPEGWAFDADGHPTTNADAALQGTMAPAGGAKGAALALMVEVLAGALTGANFSHEATSFFDGDGDPPGVGHVMLAINPGQAAPASFAHRVEALLSEIEVQDGARLPGLSRLGRRSQVAEQGLVLPGHLAQEIDATVAAV